MPSIDPDFYRNDLSQLEEGSWYLHQQRLAFSDKWGETRLYWSDNASKTIDIKYLSIIQEDDERLVLCIERQVQASQTALEHFDKIVQHTDLAYQNALATEEYAQSAQDDISSSDFALDVSQQHTHGWYRHKERSEYLLKSANSYVNPMV